MLDLILGNLRDIGYASILLAIVWLANFLLDVYYNIKIINQCWSCKNIWDDIIRFLAVCAGVTLLTIAISAFPRFISMVGLTVPEEYVDVMSILTIVALFAKGIYEYTSRAIEKLNGILKKELKE
ncbi:MAG: hypothetical protein HFE74_03435 [Firmicutes bacterium]|jgi:hypothetical protein|nr:hypothetical protein [Bacillota bacterium]